MYIAENSQQSKWGCLARNLAIYNKMVVINDCKNPRKPKTSYSFARCTKTGDSTTDDNDLDNWHQALMKVIGDLINDENGKIENFNDVENL